MGWVRGLEKEPGGGVVEEEGNSYAEELHPDLPSRSIIPSPIITSVLILYTPKGNARCLKDLLSSSMQPAGRTPSWAAWGSWPQ